MQIAATSGNQFLLLRSRAQRFSVALSSCITIQTRACYAANKTVSLLIATTARAALPGDSLCFEVADFTSRAAKSSAYCIRGKGIIHLIFYVTNMR